MSPSTLVIVAPDKFKGSLSAPVISSMITAQFRRVDPDAQLLEIPLADGGEGTVDLFVARGAERVDAEVLGPLGNPILASYARRGPLAVVESAAAAGLALLGRPPDSETALHSSTFGVGQLVRHAVERGATRVVVGLGGSATTDGGLGLAAALGARIETAAGRRGEFGPFALESIDSVDFAPMCSVLSGVEVTLATDVDTPLLGPDGAAAVFAPQKGADHNVVARLDRCLLRWATAVIAATGVDVSGVPGSGAAGGAGVPLLAAVGSQVQPGVGFYFAESGFAERLDGATLLVVGEGSLDQQSLRGKGPVGAARLARSRGVRVVAVAGVNKLTRRELDDAAIDRVYSLTDIDPDPAACIEHAAELLPRLAYDLAVTESRSWRWQDLS